MTYLFYTKIKEDEHRNGQEVRIVEKHKNGYMVLVEFPDGIQTWAYTSELVEYQK